MGWKNSTARFVAVGAAAVVASTLAGLQAQQAPATSRGTAGDPSAARDAQGGNGADLGPGLFAAADINVDGAVTRAEFKATFEKWFADSDTGRTGAVTQADLLAALKLPQPRLPLDSHMQAMLAALPDRPAAKPARPRKVLVFNRCAGFIHTPIPLTAKMIEAFGNRTKAWSTNITFDPADINTQNLKQYDAVVLNSTTGAFLDDPNDQAATDARKRALIEFVRGGKGLVGIHGAGDSYHANNGAAQAGAGAGRAGGGGGQRGAGPTLSTQSLIQGDKNNDQKLSKDETSALADAWFDKLDTSRATTLRQAEFVERLTAMMAVATPTTPRGAGAAAAPAAGAAAPAAGAARGEGGRGPQPGRDTQMGTWPDFNRMIGGFFKFHFSNQQIAVKIDDPKSPLTAMFKGQPFEFRGEIYTFAMDTWSRENLHVLTSMDYSKLSDADRAKENFPRSDHDYGMSWIRRDGKGRVFYLAFGNEERTFFIKPLNEQFLAGLQYALGDLKADDSPSAKAGTK
jgi:type 1 glutamine amidotransferase